MHKYINIYMYKDLFIYTLGHFTKLKKLRKKVNDMKTICAAEKWKNTLFQILIQYTSFVDREIQLFSHSSLF